MSEHSLERWTMVHNNGVFPNVYGPEGRFIGQVSTDEDARRIVAAVNACAGIHTASLERFSPHYFRSVVEDPDGSTRDARLAEAEALVTWIATSCTGLHGHVADRNNINFDPGLAQDLKHIMEECARFGASS